MKRTIVALAACFGLLALTACEDKGTCVQSHTEYSPPTYVKSGNVMVPIGGGTITVCDRYEHTN